MSTIAENVAHVREEMEKAALLSGRKAGEVQLLAATKMNDADRVREAIAAGIDICGENRVQELQSKLALDAYAGCPLHFIGHLQKNKAKYLVGKVDLIQSVDSVELLQILDHLAMQRQVTQDILLEVNIGGEAAKSGVEPERADELAAHMADFPHLKLRGLMTIPPVSAEEGANRRYFAKMYELYVDISAKKYDNTIMDCLSMGMSDDFTDAIKEGASLVRVGTAIFGSRKYVK